MPELPEVETTRRGLAATLEGSRIERVDVHEPRFRWPIDPKLATYIGGQRIVHIGRRAKYLLLQLERGNVIVHLGMSGSLQMHPPDTPRHHHEHVVWTLSPTSKTAISLRLRDHRRFGAVIWSADDPLEHPLLSKLGPEPLGNSFTGEVLFHASRGRRASVKAFIMDARIVAGVGNIYATEALFRARIHPSRAAGRISASRYDALAGHIRDILTESIERGGTTLRDFAGSDGSRGYFVDHLDAYGRAGEPCTACSTILKNRVIAQRSTVFCPSCQR